MSGMELLLELVHAVCVAGGGGITLCAYALGRVSEGVVVTFAYAVGGFLACTAEELCVCGQAVPRKRKVVVGGAYPALSWRSR